MPAERFTRQSVAALTVPPDRPELFAWDTMVKGFGAKVSAGGSRKWIIQYRPADQRGTRRMTIGDMTSMSLDDARGKARDMLADATKGKDPHAAKAAAKREAAVTLGTLIDRYLIFCETRQRPTTLAGARLNLRTHWEPLHTLPITMIKRSDVAGRLDVLADKNGGVTSNRCRASLSALFAWAISRGLADSNPVVGTSKVEERSRERVLSEAELAAVWHACRDDAHGRIVKLLIMTGQRRDEVGSVVESELDFDAALWTLPAARAKNGNTHLIPLSEPVLDILHAAPRVDGRAFIFGEGRGGFSGWSRSKGRLDERITEARGGALPAWTLHDIRRSVATHMADSLGVAPHLIETLLNHRSGQRGGIGAVYNRGRYLNETRAALDAWAQHVMTLTAPKRAV